jgi:hypothetical protein
MGPALLLGGLVGVWNLGHLASWMVCGSWARLCYWAAFWVFGTRAIWPFGRFVVHGAGFVIRRPFGCLEPGPFGLLGGLWHWAHEPQSTPSAQKPGLSIAHRAANCAIGPMNHNPPQVPKNPGCQLPTGPLIAQLGP